MADVESLELQIKGNASGATRSLNTLIKTLEKLEKATAGGCGLSKVSKEMKKFQNVNIGVRNSNNASALSFAKLTAKVAAAYHSLEKAGEAIMSWIQASNDYVENLNLFTVAMGEYAESAMEYANTVSEVMGIDPSAWIRSQGVFMTMAKGFGVAGDRAAVMSQQLTQLGYDISSFYNISVEEAMTKLQSGLAGELEPLRQLGYDLSQAKLEATALSLGITKSVNSMTQAEKAQLRYYAILTQVTDAHGDMARTLDAPANQLRILKAQVEQAARSLGNIFIPALNAILPYVIAAVKVVRYLADAIAKLFGYEFPEVEYSGVSDLGASADDTSEAIDETTDKVKKLKKTLLGIDELNVLPDNSSSDTKSEDSGGSWVDFELPTYDFITESVNSKVDEIVEKMKEWLGITGEIDSWSDLFDTRLGDILKIVGLIGGGIALWKIGSGVVSGIGAISTAFGFLKKLGFGKLLGDVGAFFELLFEGNSLGSVLEAAFPKISAFFASIPGAVLAGVAGIVVGVPTFIAGLYDALRDGLDWMNGSLVAAGATMTGAGIGAIIGAVGGPIGAGIGALIGLAVGLITDFGVWLYQNWDTVKEGFSNFWANVCTIFSQLWEDIKAIWSPVVEWFDANIIQPVVTFFSDLWSSISGFASSCWESIVGYFSPAITWFSELFGSVAQTVSDIFYNIGVIAGGCWDIIVEIWSRFKGWFDEKVIKPVGKYFSDMWDDIKNWAINAWEGIKTAYSAVTNWIDTNIIRPVGDFFSNLWSGFVSKARDAWDGVKSVFGSVATFFGDIFSDAWQKVVKVFSVGGEIFVNIKNAILEGFKKVVNGIIGGLNKTIAVPFNGINTALTKIRDMEILGLTPFSGLKTISVPQIPYLADGGMVNSGQLFVANEAGPELVASIGSKSAVMNNDQIVSAVSQGVYQAVVQAMAQSSGNQTVEAKVNDKVLFEVVVNRARQETVRKGFNPLLGGV